MTNKREVIGDKNISRSDNPEEYQSICARIWVTYNQLRKKYKYDRYIITSIIRTIKGVNEKTIEHVIAQGQGDCFPQDNDMYGHWRKMNSICSAEEFSPEKWHRINRTQKLYLSQVRGGSDKDGNGRGLEHVYADIWKMFHQFKNECQKNNLRDRKIVLFMLEKTKENSERTIWRVIKEGRKRGFTANQNTLGLWREAKTIGGFTKCPSTWKRK